MKLHCKFSTLFILIVAGSSLLSPQLFAQELSVNFEEQLVIGDQEDAPKEYLFGGPQFIKTDSQYRIYIADSNNSIRVFSPEGEYLKTIGRQGKGPGEFISITAMAIGHRDEVIVYDARAGRLTRFYNMGDSVETQSLPRPGWTGGEIVPLKDGQFASFAIEPSYFFEQTSKYVVGDIKHIDYEDQAIHLLEGDSWEKIRSFFNVYKYTAFDKNNHLEVKFATEDYRLAKLNDSTLVVTNEISDGSLYILDINSGDVREVAGHFTGRESYEELNWEKRHSYWGERVGIVVSSGNPKTGSVVYQRKLNSKVLLANDKWVLNFIRTADEEKSTYNLEVLDNKGNYLGYTSIEDNFDIVEEGYSDFIDSKVLKLLFYPMHLDNRDQLYYVDYSSGIPVIRVAKIILEKQ